MIGGRIGRGQGIGSSRRGSRMLKRSKELSYELALVIAINTTLDAPPVMIPEAATNSLLAYVESIGMSTCRPTKQSAGTPDQGRANE
jgi:hypothetical protein